MGPPPPPLKIFRFANQRCSCSSCAKIFAAILRTFGSSIDSYSLIHRSFVLNILNSKSVRLENKILQRVKKSEKRWNWQLFINTTKPCPKFSQIYQKKLGKIRKRLHWQLFINTPKPCPKYSEWEIFARVAVSELHKRGEDPRQDELWTLCQSLHLVFYFFFFFDFLVQKNSMLATFKFKRQGRAICYVV